MTAQDTFAKQRIGVLVALLLACGCAHDEVNDPCAEHSRDACPMTLESSGTTCIPLSGVGLDYKRKCILPSGRAACATRPECDPQPFGPAEAPDGTRAIVPFWQCLPSGWKQLRDGATVAQWPRCP